MCINLKQNYVLQSTRHILNSFVLGLFWWMSSLTDNLCMVSNKSMHRFLTAHIGVHRINSRFFTKAGKIQHCKRSTVGQGTAGGVSGQDVSCAAIPAVPLLRTGSWGHRTLAPLAPPFLQPGNPRKEHSPFFGVCTELQSPGFAVMDTFLTPKF